MIDEKALQELNEKVSQRMRRLQEEKKKLGDPPLVSVEVIKEARKRRNAS